MILNPQNTFKVMFLNLSNQFIRKGRFKIKK